MPKLKIPFVFANISYLISVKAITSRHTLKNKMFYFTVKLLVKDDEDKSAFAYYTVQWQNDIACTSNAGNLVVYKSVSLCLLPPY